MTTIIRHALKHLTLISGISPYATHNITIPSEVGDYKSQSKATAHLNITKYRGYIENNPINNPNKKLVELIFNELSSIVTQTTYTLQNKLPIEEFETGNYDLRGDIIIRRSKQNQDIHGSEYQFETLSYLKQPIKRVK